MYNLCMATKTISLTVEAYERLRAARRRPDESFTEVVLRAEWPDRATTGAELLRRMRTDPPLLSEEELDEMDRAMAADHVPEDPWKEH
jgi:predicted CopG family antitoxin